MKSNVVTPQKSSVNMVLTECGRPTGQLNLHAFFEKMPKRCSKQHVSCRKQAGKPVSMVLIPSKTQPVTGAVKPTDLKEEATKGESITEAGLHGSTLVTPEPTQESSSSPKTRKSPRLVNQFKGVDASCSKRNKEDCKDSDASCANHNKEDCKDSDWDPSEGSTQNSCQDDNEHSCSTDSFVCGDSHVSHEDTESFDESSFHSTSESE